MRPIDADALHGEISGLAVMVTGIRCGKGLLLELMNDYRKHILRAIANAPTIDAVPVVRWIPVTERLPDNKEHDWVLVQVVEDNGFRHIPQVMEYRQNINDWYGETYGWISGHNGAFIVTHWMPLPEPPMRKGENG